MNRELEPPLTAIQIESLEEEVEFLQAMERYQCDNHRPFPTWAEALEVLRSLNYRKQPADREARRESRHWQEQLQSLKEERDQLARELAELRVERHYLTKAMLALMPCEEFTMTKEEVLAQVGKEKPLRELLSDLEKTLED